MTRLNLLALQRLADHPGGSEENLGRPAVRCGRRDLRRELRRLTSRLAGKGVGVAGIDHEGSRPPRLELGATPVDRRGRAFGPREDAGDGRAGVEQGEQDVGAPGVADAGRRGRQANAGHLRHVREMRRGKRRNGGRHGGRVDQTLPLPAGERCRALDCERDHHRRRRAGRSILLRRRRRLIRRGRRSAGLGSLVEALDLRLRPQLVQKIDLRLAGDEGFDLVLHLVEFGRLRACACPRS